VRYPHQKKQERKGGPKRREGLKLPRRLQPKEANRPERLVPIRLEFDADHHKMRDTFVWNLNDPVVQPEHFAQSLIEDYQLPISYRSTITKSIEDQLADYKTHSLLYDTDTGEPVNPNEVGPQLHGSLEDKDAQWWESWRKQLMAEYVLGRRRKRSERRGAGRKKRKGESAEVQLHATTDGTFDETEDVKEEETEETDLQERPLRLDEFPQSVHMPMPEDLRILIKLDIMVGQMKLDDQFEWDLDNASPSPEQFADTYVQDLGLGGEFKTAIAHSIREQVQTYQKSLFLVGHPSDGTAVQDDELRLSFLPTLSSAARPMDQVLSFTPQLNHLSDGEIDRTEKDRDKDLARRRKRNTRGRRGIALPDREPIRTYRTPAIGFPELSAAAMALAVANNAPTSRRAAAAAAQLTIANMVANENGDRESYSSRSTPVPQMTQPMLQAAAKEKKTRGFFKPPEYPRSETIRPRAFVKAPTASTAGEPSRVTGLSDVEVSVSVSYAPISKIVSAKRQKELEREAKEKEFADTQHENMIDGVWHCSNCGCPEGIAVGRRKGPLGDKSQCGACGKFWHRHRRPRPVEYNSNTQHHTQLQKDAESAKSSSRRKKAPASNGPTDIASEPPTPLMPKIEIPQAPNMDDDDKGAPSPISTASSTSEPPISQQDQIPAKPNGTAPPISSAEDASAPAAEIESLPTPPLTTTTSSESVPKAAFPALNNIPEEWLAQVMDALHTRFPNDRFELTLRRPVAPATEPEWRIKCLDCPGKLYKPGPGETMSNFEVHLKNRLHRQRVSDRITGVVTVTPPAATPTPAAAS
jgi:SWI/SNF-related matrix-associated actin-dependent regulator of chromatin subfamily B protein 1